MREANYYSDEAEKSAIIERRQDMDGRPSGQTTQYELLDYTLVDFEDGKIYVIAGRTGMGKSALALQLLYRLADQSK